LKANIIEYWASLDPPTTQLAHPPDGALADLAVVEGGGQQQEDGLMLCTQLHTIGKNSRS